MPYIGATLFLINLLALVHTTWVFLLKCSAWRHAFCSLKFPSGLQMRPLSWLMFSGDAFLPFVCCLSISPLSNCFLKSQLSPLYFKEVSFPYGLALGGHGLCLEFRAGGSSERWQGRGGLCTPSAHPGRSPVMWHAEDIGCLFILGFQASVRIIITLFPAGFPRAPITSAWCPHLSGLFWHTSCVWEPWKHWLDLTGPSPSFLMKQYLPEHMGWRLLDLLSTVEAEIPSVSLGCGIHPSFSFLRICSSGNTKGQLVSSLQSLVHGNLKWTVKYVLSKE